MPRNQHNVLCNRFGDEAYLYDRRQIKHYTYYPKRKILSNNHGVEFKLKKSQVDLESEIFYLVFKDKEFRYELRIRRSQHKEDLYRVRLTQFRRGWFRDHLLETTRLHLNDDLMD